MEFCPCWAACSLIPRTLGGSRSARSQKSIRFFESYSSSPVANGILSKQPWARYNYPTAAAWLIQPTEFEITAARYHSDQVLEETSSFLHTCNGSTVLWIVHVFPLRLFPVPTQKGNTYSSALQADNIFGSITFHLLNPACIHSNLMYFYSTKPK